MRERAHADAKLSDRRSSELEASIHEATAALDAAQIMIEEQKAQISSHHQVSERQARQLDTATAQL